MTHHHPLLDELLQICTAHDVEPAKAYSTFEVFQDLSEVRKLSDLEYAFNPELKLFYLSGKRETQEVPDIYIPVMFSDGLTLQEIKTLQQTLSPEHKQLYLYIRDSDSSSTCYSVTGCLVKPDSPDTCKRKKELEGKKYQFDKILQSNRKLFYMKALKQKKADGEVMQESPT